MQTVIIVIHLMLVTALIGVVLLQRSEGGGLGMGGSGGGGGFMSSRGTGNLLTRATAVLAGLFFVTSLALSIIASMGRQPTSILTPLGTQQAPGVPGAPAPAGQPAQPGRGVLDTLRGPEQPAAPAAPAAPQVPQSQ